MALPRDTIECPQGVYEEQIIITADMTDASGLMRPGGLAREMEKITASHLETCGLIFRRVLKIAVSGSLQRGRSTKTGTSTTPITWIGQRICSEKASSGCRRQKESGCGTTGN